MKSLTATSVAVLLCFLMACTKKEPEGYRVTGYDASTHQWTILRTGTFDGKYLRKRLTVICAGYQWGKHEPVNGPEACHLQVGRLIVPNLVPKKPADFLDVYEMPDEVLSITEGEGADMVMQQFSILKYELLHDDSK